MPQRKSKREDLLKAATRVIMSQGASALTLDAVAAEAKVSKGGLLYHFPSKDALISGLVARIVESFEGLHQQSLKSTPKGPGSWTRAYLRASFPSKKKSTDTEVSAALIAAVALNPELLAPWRERAEAWTEKLAEDGLDGVDAHVVRFAVDGLWMADLLGIAQPKELRRRIVERLLELAGKGT